MRSVLMAVAMALVLAGAGVAGAQIVDPITGMTVDPVTDPVDYMDVLSGQPTNVGMEMNALAVAQAQAAQQQAMQAALTAPNLFPADGSPAAVPAPVERTPKPAMSPKGGSFRGAVQVKITDGDLQATIHYTTDGSTPTAASPTYVAPLTVTGKTKLRAMAVDGKALPSGVVTKTFKVKS